MPKWIESPQGRSLCTGHWSGISNEQMKATAALAVLPSPVPHVRP